MIRTAVVLSVLLLATPASARQEAPARVWDHGHEHARDTAHRYVVLDGGRNFRDIGGYRTADGRVVRTGVMYRSGSLGKLTPAGQAALQRLHVAAVVDLRTTEERSHDSYDLRGAFGPGYWTRDYGIERAQLGIMPEPAKLTKASIETMMARAYRTLPQTQAPAYRELFARLVTTEGPLVVNCTAGKDRTGIAAALVLTALGVPYATVRQDFLLSNGAPGMESLQAELSPMFSELPADVLAPMIGVEGSYLDNAFEQLRKDYGSIEAFLEKELGVGSKEIAVLRRRMLR